MSLADPTECDNDRWKQNHSGKGTRQSHLRTSIMIVRLEVIENRKKKSGVNHLSVTFATVCSFELSKLTIRPATTEDASENRS